MTLKTGEEYVESIRQLDLKIFLFGERLENPVDHPILRPSLNSVKATYDIAQDPELQHLATAISPFTLPAAFFVPFPR